MNRSEGPLSPPIDAIEWGKIEVENLGSFKDVKLWPGGGRAWDWNETGTRHDPGIQPQDVEELLTYSPTAIVLSKGMHLRLKCCPDTLALLEQRGLTVYEAETKDAVETYNRLAEEGQRVAGLFHSTC